VFDQIQWPGRLQIVQQHPRIYFDVSHNYSGVETTLDFIRAHYDRASTRLLLGLLADKEYKRIAGLLAAHFKQIVVTEPNSERKLPAVELAEVFRACGKTVECIPDPAAAFNSCRQKMETDETLFVMGSHFLIGELSKGLKEKSLTSK